MKQLLLFAMLCIGMNTTKAQSLTIHNYNACDVHYLMYGDDPVGNCGASYRSDIYTIQAAPVPGIVPFSITYPDPSVVPFPGMVNGGGMTLGPSGWFSHVRFPECNPNLCSGCSTSSVVVGDVSCGASNTASHNINNGCPSTPCGLINITYTNVGGNVTVEIR